VRAYAKNPGEAAKKSWTALGPSKEIKGIATRKGKWFPRLAYKKGVPSAAAPSLGRIFFVGQALEAARAAARAKKGQKGQHVGRMLGGSLGWLASARMKFLPSLATWSGGEAAGAALGRLISKKT